MSAEPAPVVRIVKPRKPGTSALPIIAVTRVEVLLERTGETFPIDELPAVVTAEDSSIIVGQSMGEIILRLSDAFRESETFQYKLTPIYRDLHPVNGECKRRAVLRDTVTSLVGFPGHYHHPIEPSSFIRQSLDEIDPRDLPEIVRLLEWAQAVRNFCIRNDLKVKPSSGGLAAQLLRDRRFYPEARRKAPGLLNGKLREKLPGNYYRLEGELDHEYTDAFYIDMENSHHELAKTIEFPCANSLYAYGSFSREADRPLAQAGTARFDRLLASPGAFYVNLSSPIQPPGRFHPPYMETPGERAVWIYSNELPFIRECGGKILTIYAAVISDEVETGLNKYAEWALEEIRDHADDKPWLKPVLHSAYGVIAGRPRPLEIGWRRANGGDEDHYPMGPRMVPVKVLKTRKAIEPRIVNVLHRSMIEAEQRTRALQLANQIVALKGEVLCIYADSLFVRIKQLPLLEAPWRCKAEVTGLIFYSATQFVSRQITRLPGVPRHLQENFAPACRTRTLDPHNGLPVRADNGTRIFRPSRKSAKLRDARNIRPKRSVDLQSQHTK